MLPRDNMMDDINAAETNGKNDVVKLVQGTYGISGNGYYEFNYSSSE